MASSPCRNDTTFSAIHSMHAFAVLVRTRMHVLTPCSWLPTRVFVSLLFPWCVCMCMCFRAQSGSTTPYTRPSTPMKIVTPRAQVAQDMGDLCIGGVHSGGKGDATRERRWSVGCVEDVDEEEIRERWRYALPPVGDSCRSQRNELGCRSSRPHAGFSRFLVMYV